MESSDTSKVVVKKVKGSFLFLQLLYTPIIGLCMVAPLVMMDGTRIPLGALPFVYIVCLFRYAIMRSQKVPYMIDVDDHFTTINYCWFFWDKQLIIENSDFEIKMEQHKSSLHMNILSTNRNFFRNMKETFFIYSKQDNWTNTEIIRLMEIFQSHSVKVTWI